MILELLILLVTASLPRPATVAPAPAPVAVKLAPVPVYIHVLDWRRLTAGVDVISPACDALNLACQESVYTEGVVTILLTDPFPVVTLGFPVDSTVLGLSSGTACEGRVWAVSHPRIVTHELAHALGLEHLAVEGNVMHPYPLDHGGDDLTDEQLRTVRAGAAHMRSC